MAYKTAMPVVGGLTRVAPKGPCKGMKPPEKWNAHPGKLVYGTDIRKTKRLS